MLGMCPPREKNRVIKLWNLVDLQPARPLSSYLVADTFEECFPVAPAQDEKSKEKLEDEAPADVTPHDILATFRAESSQRYNDKDSASRNQSFPVSLGVEHQENPDDNYD